MKIKVQVLLGVKELGSFENASDSPEKALETLKEELKEYVAQGVVFSYPYFLEFDEANKHTAFACYEAVMEGSDSVIKSYIKKMKEQDCFEDSDIVD